MTTERFDKAAAGWDAKPRRVALAQAIATAIGADIPLTPSMTGLEYGCGTGLVTFEVAQSLGSVHGLDQSSGMIAVLAEKCAAQGVTNVTPFLGDLADLDCPAFDLIMICMTLHHIDDHLQLLRDCYARLASGGFVAIADLEREDGSFHEDTTGIFHFGFDSEKLRADVESIGFTEVLSRQIHLLSRHDRDYPVFLLTAQKK